MARRPYFAMFLIIAAVKSSVLQTSDELDDLGFGLSQYFNDWNENLRRLRARKMEVSRTVYLDVDWILEKFEKENSMLLFTGATDLFNFSTFSKIPFVSVNQAVFRQFVYNNKSTDQLVLSVSKTIRQQVVVHAVAPGASDRVTETFEEKTSIHPQTLIVFNTLKLRTHVLESQYSVLNAFLGKGRPLMYVLDVDLETNAPGDGHLICQFCSFNKHVFTYTTGQTVRLGQQLRMVKFQWTPVTAGEILKQVRSVATGNGRNLEWSVFMFQFVNLDSCEAVKEDFTNRNPLDGTSHKSILKQHPFRIIVLQALFPLRNVSQDSENLQCHGKHGKGTFDPTYASRGVSFNSPTAKYQLPIKYVSSETKEEEDIIFVTSENVRLKGGKNPTDLYVDVFDYQVWYALLLCLLVSALAYPFLKMGRSRADRSSFYAEGREGVKWTLDFLYRRVAGLLGQDWNESSRLHGNSRAIAFITVPWHLATLVLVFWYTSYINSSFNFIFPYELEFDSWRDFENFSLFIFYTRQDQSNDSIIGHWDTKDDRDFMLWDMNNFRGRKPGEGNYNPMRKQYTGLQMQPGWLTADGSEEEILDLNPVLKWFKHKMQKLVNGSSPEPDVNPTYIDKENIENLSSKDGILLQRMLYRIDFIQASNLHEYIGSTYVNSINKGKKFGLALLDILKDKKVSTLASIQWKSGNWTDFLMQKRKTEMGEQLYWMTRKPKAAFVMVKSDFPWYWNLFKKVMKEDASIKFAHTGPLELRNLRRDQGLGGNGFESPTQVRGPLFFHLPELDWVGRRIRALGHSGLLGFFAKWDKILFPPLKDPMNAVIEESVTRSESLSTKDDAITALFAVFFWGIVLSVSVFVLESSFLLAFNSTDKA